MLKTIIILSILLINGCTENSKNYVEIHGTTDENCCESDVNIEPANNDNTIIISISDKKILGYCYVGWDS
jgi:hypothetical protein